MESPIEVSTARRSVLQNGVLKRLDPALADMSQFDRGDLAFMIMAGALVFFMVPGLAFLYGGLSRRKSALHVAWAVLGSNAVVIAQWFLFGHSLAFSGSSTNSYIGNMANMGMKGVLGGASRSSSLIPDLLLSFFQLEIACVTSGIWIGAVADRGRILPSMVFTFFWMTLVYCPLVYWIWNPSGWAWKYGVLDFAGGGPVEIGAGFTGLAYSWALGRRRERELLNFRVSSVNLVYLGQFVLWFGWIGFNAGSAYGANLRAIVATWNTMLAGGAGCITWCLIDYRLERKYTMVGLCFGSLAGLIAATPSSGFLPPWASVLLGIIAATCCNMATKIKGLLRIDDAMDIFAEHGMGGMVGLLFTALLADSRITGLDGINTTTKGGFLNHNWQQLHIQVVYIMAAASYTFLVSMVLLKLIDLIPGLRLRCTEEEETMGMDAADIGEFAHDFVEIRRDYRDWAQSGYRAASRHSKAYSVASSFTENGDRHNDDYSIHESIAHDSIDDYDGHKSRDVKDFTLSMEIPSPFFELPRTPKNTHVRLGTTPKATHIKLTPKVSHMRLAEPKGQQNDSSSFVQDYIKPPNL